MKDRLERVQQSAEESQLAASQQQLHQAAEIDKLRSRVATVETENEVS